MKNVILRLLTVALLTGCHHDDRSPNQQMDERFSCLAIELDDLERAVTDASKAEVEAINQRNAEEANLAALALKKSVNADYVAVLSGEVAALQTQLAADEDTVLAGRDELTKQIGELAEHVAELQRQQKLRSCPACAPPCCPGPCEKCDCPRTPWTPPPNVQIEPLPVPPRPRPKPPAKQPTIKKRRCP